MEELYEYFGSLEPINEPNFDHLPFEVIEIWHNQTSGKLSTQPSDLKTWLKSSLNHNPASKTTSSCLVRIALIDKDPKQPWNSTPDVSQIVNHFGLGLAFNYAKSCAIGVAALPPQSTSNGNTNAYIVAHPKLATIWSAWQPASVSPPAPSNGSSNRNPVSLTQAIILASATERNEIKRLLGMRTWAMGLTSHAMFPAFLCGLIIDREVGKTHRSINDKMRSVEARTGHHNSKTPDAQPARESWGHLSAMTSGFARKLASTSRKIQMATVLQKFIVTHAKKASVHVESELVEHHAGLINSRLEMQRLQNEFLLQKANIQLTAIFNLMARKDSTVGLQSASSMKALALLAMAFMPGNFLAALFSAPLFDWDSSNLGNGTSIGVSTKPQFDLFWAITAPLTALAFILFVLWSFFEKRRFETTLDEEQS